ncbi:hypothetical protein [Salibacterium halotolerans]|uniref:tRNA nucleotidyltransferase (CCA-adding enzyme) n=1 Tax=Salibacterium halotolerans TaxID=1884432 RepID=A0A1I5Q9A1_9BACI|nr:hypothetical protein [Salibacterium halotolerans]SFP42630.1 tRNA nucleotidyltransferase (CCA-adding enzyme) [Salibacterium halotolerans]
MYLSGPAWNAALETLEYLAKHGVRGYVTGGAVRDTLLPRKIRDIDIVLEASSEVVLSLFPQAVQPSAPFPVFIVPRGGHVFEITTFHPDKQTLQENLEQRDFTINAMAVDRSGRLIDPGGGENDINRQRIRSVFPQERMQEDPLRRVRAFRFVSELGFSVDELTWQALCTAGNGLWHTAEERIQREIEKLLTGMDNSRALGLLLRSGVLHDFPPSIRPEHVLKKQKHPNMASFSSIEEKWTVFFFLLYGGQAGRFVSRWPMKKSLQKRIRHIIQVCTANPDEIEWNTELVYRNGKRCALQIETVHQWRKGKQNNGTLEHIEELARLLPIASRSDLKVDGSDIVKLHPALPGKQIGHLLTFLEEEVLQGRAANTHKELLSLVKEKLSHER